MATELSLNLLFCSKSNTIEIFHVFSPHGSQKNINQQFTSLSDELNLLFSFFFCAIAQYDKLCNRRNHLFHNLNVNSINKVVSCTQRVILDIGNQSEKGVNRHELQRVEAELQQKPNFLVIAILLPIVTGLSFTILSMELFHEFDIVKNIENRVNNQEYDIETSWNTKGGRSLFLGFKSVFSIQVNGIVDV